MREIETPPQNWSLTAFFAHQQGVKWLYPSSPRQGAATTRYEASRGARREVARTASSIVCMSAISALVAGVNASVRAWQREIYALFRVLVQVNPKTVKE